MREKLIELLGADVCKHDCCDDCEHQGSTDACVAELKAQMADHLIANGVTIQKWIPVTERLPEVRTPVLTYGRKGAVGIGFVQPTSKAADGKVYFYPRYGDNLPTHWMPLPEPPKGDSI